MKGILFILIGILLFSCNQKSGSPAESKNDVTELKADVGKSFDWLLGKWKRIDEKPGKETFENWEEINEAEYSGLGFTMQEEDTIWQEAMVLSAIDKKWELIVKSPGEEAVHFKMTHYSDSSFTVENHEIDFPNEIMYLKNGNKINASVVGGDTKIAFEFEKLSE